MALNPLERTTLQGFSEQRVPLRFLGPEFEDGMILERNKSRPGVIQIYQSKVFCYHDSKALRSRYNIHDNGFQFVPIKNQLLESITQYALNPSDEKCASDVSRYATSFIASWANENGMKFCAVVPLGLVYRNTNEREEEAFKAVDQVHVDFQKSDLSNTLRSLEDVWKSQIETVTGELSKNQYLNLKITHMFNLWMSLNTRPTKNGLVIMDTNTFKPNRDLRQFKSLGPEGTTFSSLSVDIDTKQQWVAQMGMTIGDGLIFSSCITPHSAGNFMLDPDIECDKDRMSLEGRFALLEVLPTN